MEVILFKLRRGNERRNVEKKNRTENIYDKLSVRVRHELSRPVHQKNRIY